MATIQEIVVGRRVKVRGCPGLGVGTVVYVETNTWNADGTSIPLIGFVRAMVDFGPDDFGPTGLESFSSRELIVVSS